MISKRLTPSFWFQDQPIAHLLNVHSSGKLDRGQLQKIAASDYVFQADVKPVKGSSFIHLISVGGGEWYGTNGNADYYNKYAHEVTIPHPANPARSRIMLKGGLTDFHSTFLKYGAVYREHHNSKKGGKPSGTVAFETVNPVMHRGELIIQVPNDKWATDLQKLATGQPIYFSIGAGVPYDTCFTAGTEVETGAGLRPIEDIQIGQLVRTHTGKLRPTTAHMTLEYSGTLYKFESAGWQGTGWATEDHPYLVVSRKDLACQGSTNGKKIRHTTVDGVHCRRCGRELPSPRWVAAKGVAPGDYLCTPRTPFGIRRLSTERGWLLGLYLGDGHIMWQHTGHNKRNAAIRDMGVGWTVGRGNEDILAHLRKLGATAGFDNQVRVYPYKHKTAWEVHVSDQGWAAEVQELVGSGCHRKNLRAVLGELDLESVLNVLAGYLDSDGNVTQGRNNLRFSTVSRELAYTFREVVCALGVGCTVHEDEHDTPYGPVYSYVMVAGPQLYEMLYGRSVKLARYAKPKTMYIKSNALAYNGFCLQAVDRVLISSATCTVHNLSVAEDESYVADGYAVHNCSECGNEAKTREQYCEHMKYNKLGLTKEGNQVFCYNDETYYHDISQVGTPADKIAFGLRKVASLGGETTFECSDDGLWLPLSVISAAGTQMEQKRAALLSKLADIEKTITAHGMAEDEHLAGSAVGSDLPEDKLQALKKFPLPDLLSSLGRHNCMLSPRDFVRVVLVRKPDADIPGLAGLPAALRGVFGKLEDESGLEAASDSAYSGSSSRHWAGLEELVGSLVDHLSVSAEPLRKRITVLVICGEPRGEKEAATTQTFPNAAAQVLAHEYAKYQLAFLADGGHASLAKLAVLQNLTHSETRHALPPYR